MSEYKMPKIAGGTLIVYAQDFQRFKAGQTLAGVVAKAKNRGADVQVFTPAGLEYKFDCVHADDPDLVYRKEAMDERFGFGDSGVFDLAPMVYRDMKRDEEWKEMMSKIAAERAIEKSEHIAALARCEDGMKQIAVLIARIATGRPIKIDKEGRVKLAVGKSANRLSPLVMTPSAIEETEKEDVVETA